jgi:hypothetical protein
MTARWGGKMGGFPTWRAPDSATAGPALKPQRAGFRASDFGYGLSGYNLRAAGFGYRLRGLQTSGYRFQDARALHWAGQILPIRPHARRRAQLRFGAGDRSRAQMRIHCGPDSLAWMLYSCAWLQFGLTTCSLSAGLRTAGCKLAGYAAGSRSGMVRL